MKLKYFLFIILLALILFFLIFTYVNNESKIVDNSTSFDDNNNWINKDMNITRNNNFTTLSSTSNSSSWLMANYTISNDSIIEWDNHGNISHSDYCIISNKDRTQDTPLSFDDFNMTSDCHVKLVVKDNKITPYINDVMKKPITLNAKQEQGLFFRFQINNNGSEIMYSNFKIHPN